MKKLVASQLEAGDVVKIQNQVWTIVTCTEVLDPGRCPDDWAPHWREGAHIIEIERGDNEIGRCVIPFQLQSSVQFIASKDDEGHWPVCSSCGDIWPCNHIEMLQDVKDGAKRVIAQFEREQREPFPCLWCKQFSNSVRRFKTERGLKSHISRCKSNPNTWDLDAWVPIFNAKLKVAGGFRPTSFEHMNSMARAFGGSHFNYNELLQIANEVKVRAVDGTLPDGSDAASKLLAYIGLER